jgi:8-oxo-dGTP pyrophosphatase MutT (NUDIX family)
MSKWQRLDTKVVYQNDWMTVHEDNVIGPEGKPSVYSWVETPPAVFVVAITDDNKVQLVRREHYTTGLSAWDLPSASSGGQELLDTAKRALLEKTGLNADRWEMVGEYFAWKGIATQRNTAFVAHGLHHARGHQLPDASADVLKAVSWHELTTMMTSGELNDSESITALSLAGLHLGHLK